MADSKGRPIIRPRDVEADRVRKRREWLMGQRATDPDAESEEVIDRVRSAIL